MAPAGARTFPYVLMAISFASAWVIVLIPGYSDSAQKGAWGIIGSLVGYCIAAVQQDPGR